MTTAAVPDRIEGQRSMWLPPWLAALGRLAYREGFGALLLVALFLFIVGPMLSVVLWAFAVRWQYPSLVPNVFGFHFWRETFRRADILTAIPQSITITVIATALSALVSLPASYAFARLRFPGRQFLLLSFLATNAFPRFGLYITIAVVFFRLDLIGTVPGVILIQVVNTLLLMIWIPTAAFRSVDRSLEEAALNVGASRLRVFVQITLPLVFPGDCRRSSVERRQRFLRVAGVLDHWVAQCAHRAGAHVQPDEQPARRPIRRGSHVCHVDTFADSACLLAAVPARALFCGWIRGLDDEVRGVGRGYLIRDRPFEAFWQGQSR